MIEAGVVLLASVLAGGVEVTAMAVESGTSHAEQVQAWRKQRVERLTAPEGWLSLVGLHWLKDGEQSIGSSKGSDVVLAVGPAKLGRIALADGKVELTLDPNAKAKIGESAETKAVLSDDGSANPTKVSFGTANFYVIDRGGKKGLRVKDTEAETRKKFVGIDYFDIASDWRVEAKWEAYNPPREIEVPTVLGTVEKYPVPGKATFERDGKKYELLPVLEAPGDKELFIIFADRTSGKETYGAARFLYAAMPADGKIVLDFNKAYNPPCAFTPYATCPLAPPENRLDLRVTAGEKKYRGAHH
ncbi:DUF1684 domain-containing protein [Tahibacter amnicola]|uniref:DUF1684 domain-containing protein n=1 Tax=Tahibacter amnicola TaxID=2976241 RepID=A0ABY6BA16_9GAMM|nr:DUF1684 domain-containing protein [Tahibacter amnicola]UXI66903.1 DUF1684 domain-containing protein [Tahibacter amnicola]